MPISVFGFDGELLSDASEQAAEDDFIALGDQSEQPPVAIGNWPRIVDGVDHGLPISVNPEELASDGSIHSAFADGSEIAANYCEGVDKFVYNADGVAVGGFGVRPGAGDVEGLLRQTLPRTKQEQLAKAESYFKEDDLLQSLIKVKIKFGMSGFGLNCKPVNLEEEDEDPATANKKPDPGILKFKERLQTIARKHKLRKVTKDLLRDWHTTENSILYWRVDIANSGAATGSESGVPVTGDEGLIPGLVDVCALSPKDVLWDNAMGNNILRIRIPDAVREQINLALNRVSEQERQEALKQLLDQGISQRWIDSVRGTDASGNKVLYPGFVELRNDEGDYWIINTDARKHYGLSWPSMFAIFLNLELRRSLIQGEFSAAFMMKHFIQLIQTGESITQGPRTGMKDNWLKKKEAADVLKIFTNVSQSIRMVANHTLKVSFVFPPKEMFNEEKYKVCEDRVFNWAGVVVSVMKGEGGTYSGGFIGIKRLIADLQENREDVSEMWTEFFDHPSIKSRLTDVPDNLQVIARFDENILKEPAQLLNEVKFLVSQGMLDPYTAIKELGRDPDLVKALKQVAIADGETWNNLMQILKDAQELRVAEQGVANGNSGDPAGDPATDPAAGDGPGRPPNPTTTRNPNTRIQRPIAVPQS